MPPRRRGRPRLDGDRPTLSLSVRVPEPVFDRVCTRAQRDRVSLGDVVRRALTQLLDDDEHDDE